MSVVHVNQSNFQQEVIQSSIPVLLDFGASWCTPCKMLSPIMDELGRELEGKVKVCKIDIEEERELAAKFKIMSIPTLVLVRDKNIIRLGEGFKSKKDILKMIQ